MKVCIECQKDVTGLRAVMVKEDQVIRIIRRIKRILKISKENELYVCAECLPKQLERRKAFERTVLVFTAIAALLLLLMLIAIIFSGRFEIWTVVSAVLIAVFLFLFAFIFRYVPAVESVTPQMIPAAVEIKPPQKSGKKQNQPKGKKKERWLNDGVNSY